MASKVMRRLGLLIEEVRLQTENEESSDTIGITDREIIRYANDAQERLQSKIVQLSTDHFVTETTFSIVQDQEAYDLPNDTYIDSMINLVEYSNSGNVRDYYVLNKIQEAERISFAFGRPSFYWQSNGKIYFAPTPNQATGTIRLRYVRKIDRLDIRRGQVDAVTLDTGSRTITSLTLDTTQLSTIDQVNKIPYLCVVDADGEVKMRNIPFTNIDESTGAVTVPGSFTYVSGETISVDDYIVSGQDTTTHAQLPPMCERYIIAYANWKMMKRDANAMSPDQSQELVAMEEDILGSFAKTTDDIDRITILNDAYLEPTDGYW